VAQEAVESAAAALNEQTTIRGLLETACTELAQAIGATACAVSRVVGDLLVGLVEQSRDRGRRLELGHEYLISEYPLTKEVIDRNEPRRVSLLDDDPEPNEAALLRKLGFESLLMVCLPSGGGCWGLVEAYGDGKRFDDADAALAEQIAKVAGEQLERLEAG
jgi:GAF domain-containing protein